MRKLDSEAVLEIMREYPANYILSEKGSPSSDVLQRDRIVLKEADGSEVQITDEDGRQYSAELTPDIFHDLLQSGAIQPKNSTEDLNQVYIRTRK